MSIDALLGRPAQEGVRTRALELLEAARVERGRLDDASDVEAVHDFRVALRRLRSLLKAYRARLGRKVDKVRRELGDIADATGTARDAEVQLEWLGGQRTHLTPARRRALDWLCARLEEQKQSGYGAVRARAAHDFDDLLGAARRRLGRFERDLSAPEEPPLAAALAELLVECSEALAARLAEVDSAADEERAHEARILGKQLRYLLEPLADSELGGTATKAAIKDLKSLQDILGELHDAHVLGHVVQEAMVEFAAERARRLGALVFDKKPADAPPDLRPGLVAIAERVRDRRDGLYRRLVQLRPGVKKLSGEVRTLAEELGGKAPGVEIEKKYLLRGMPKLPKAEVLHIEQGYLPGTQLVERLRRVRTADGAAKHLRTMKLGVGIKRIEVEEECSDELFAKLWPVTEGRRITKVRHEVREGSLIWEIDQFSDRDLVVAEVELPAEDTVVSIPEWLAASVVRDVTGEKEYTNAALASAGPAPSRKAAARKPAAPAPPTRRSPRRRARRRGQ
jgi:CHAD domain-containing protein/CYTH domain-containing protein